MRSRLRVGGVDAITLEVVAACASQPEIFSSSWPSERFGNEVLNVQWHAKKGFGRVTVSAPRLSICPNLVAELR